MPRAGQLSRVLARGRAAFAWALVLVATAGCAANGAATSSVTVPGGVLTIYLSDPPTDQPLLARDVNAAERLAFGQAPARVGSFTVRLLTLNGAISANARKAIQDTSAIAYLGEVVPHSSSGSIGITNALDLLQVSPTDTALELTQATPAVPGAPDTYYESLSSYQRTFARVAPSSAREAEAQVREIQALGVTRLYVADDGGPYGAAIAAAVRHDAGRTLTVVSSQGSADGVFYGSSSPTAAARFFAAAASANPSVKLFAPSALDAPAFVAGLSPAVRNLYVSAPGFLARAQTPAADKFVSDFRAAYGRAPVGQALFGYEAMAALLAVLREAGSHAGNRATVVKDFLSLKRSQSVLGPYAMDGNGDTNIAPFVFSRLAHGQLVPFAQVEG